MTPFKNLAFRAISLLLLASSLSIYGRSDSIVTDKPVVIKSSVSAEFRGGLHEKYLQYMADKMGMSLEIIPMPFNRRVMSLRQGVIDLMTGLKSDHEENGEFVFLQPSYESLRTLYFVRADSGLNLQSRSDLYNHTLAITADEKTLLDELKKEGINAIAASTLEQKIDLLMKGRVDAFSHFEFSTLIQLEKMGIEDQVVAVEGLTAGSRDYHFAISLNSPLMRFKDQFEAVIKQGVDNGDFAAMRKAHYLEIESKQ